MSTRCPLVSIGVPVYNGERYLEQLLESLLAWTNENLEIIISDNASTDRTGEICRRCAESDSRIRYHRNEKNLDHTVNTNQIVPMARGTYYRQHYLLSRRPGETGSCGDAWWDRGRHRYYGP